MKTKLLILSLILFSCGNKVDIEKVKQELLETDKQFSELSVEHGKNHAFLSYLHEEGVILLPNSMPVEGKNKIAKLYQDQPDSSYTLKWKPLHATASKSADLGFTYGLWKLATNDTSLMGTYVTIWKKNDKGEWKFILDSGNVGLGGEEEKEQF